MLRLLRRRKLLRLRPGSNPTTPTFRTGGARLWSTTATMSWQPRSLPLLACPIVPPRKGDMRIQFFTYIFSYTYTYIFSELFTIFFQYGFVPPCVHDYCFCHRMQLLCPSPPKHCLVPQMFNKAAALEQHQHLYHVFLDGVLHSVGAEFHPPPNFTSPTL